jgi:hypothetical protein
MTFLVMLHCNFPAVHAILTAMKYFFVANSLALFSGAAARTFTVRDIFPAPCVKLTSVSRSTMPVLSRFGACRLLYLSFLLVLTHLLGQR